MSDVREQLLDIGLRAIRLYGYDGVSIKDIVTEAGVPKGSFHYYFESKESFALELMPHFGRWIEGITGPALLEPGKPAIERLRNFFRAYAEQMRLENFQTGCLTGLLSLEIANRSESLRTQAAQGMNDFKELLLPIIKMAQAEGDIKAELDPDNLASFLVSGWEGAMVRMKAEQSDRAIQVFEQMVFEEFLGA